MAYMEEYLEAICCCSETLIYIYIYTDDREKVC